MSERKLECGSTVRGEKKAWHEPAVTVLDFDRTTLIANARPCDSGCCCCAYTPS